MDEYFISLSQFLTDEEVKSLRPNTYKNDIKRAYSHRKKILKSCNKSRTIHRYLQYEMVTYIWILSCVEIKCQWHPHWKCELHY